MDLIRLSRTNKSLRNILLSRTCRTVWTSTLASIPNMPPCPPHLTEPQYARLAFENVCHVSVASLVHCFNLCLDTVVLLCAVHHASHLEPLGTLLQGMHHERGHAVRHPWYPFDVKLIMCSRPLVDVSETRHDKPTALDVEDLTTEDLVPAANMIGEGLRL
jgi:hypothetical protein